MATTMFLRIVAVLVGLANLVLLTIVTELFDDASLLLLVLAAVVAGLVTSQLVLRWFKRQFLAQRFSDRYAIMVIVVCLGGTLMGFLLAAALTLNRTLVPGPPEILERMLMSLAPGLVGAALGSVLGIAEGLILAFPLAAILGRFRNTN